MSNIRDFVSKRRQPKQQVEPEMSEVPFQVFKGPKGDKGNPGIDGKDGLDGVDGKDGKDADEAYVLKLVQAITDLRTRVGSLEQDEEEDEGEEDDDEEPPEFEPGTIEELKAPRKFKFQIQRDRNGLIKDVIAEEIL